MKRFFVLLLVTILLFSACTSASPAPTANSAASSMPEESFVPASGESSSAPQPEALPYVQQLARDRVRSLALGNMQREEAVRAAYTFLVESIYLSDPIGLDIWRYLSDETDAIPYLENRALSPFLYGIGSCEDFAAAMVLLLQHADFETKYVAGFTLSVKQEMIDHAWAMVKMDGKWYHLDPQLEQNVTRSGFLTYRYYLKSDQDMLIDHLWGEYLINYWPQMPDFEKAQIRTSFLVPVCPDRYPQVDPLTVILPTRPNRDDLLRQIAQLKREGAKGVLFPIRLYVEPPILVGEHHITPPLVQDEYNPAPFDMKHFSRSDQ